MSIDCASVVDRQPVTNSDRDQLPLPTGVEGKVLYDLGDIEDWEFTVYQLTMNLTSIGNLVD
jgi:hypothetical protein